ncbi:MD-2-related lipid-recognition domain-containing protein [Strongyloides ratti]|uniref:MD-2-related lipid-recognition domain-containing protein n=1 Tax=Strongyloides ratti TaxID=34506 RepID=A0A090LL15_STRRB|nr:MD-2-related lipid-recognition domain-containing protein [Strongyloides ratti]CEF70519.1 MD-2-related lipid-recognition domain-containing protein [Strongyloides ratti]
MLFIQLTLCCENFPNGTETKLHWYKCFDSGDIIFYSLDTTDEKNNSMYPIKLRKPLYVNINMDNNGETSSLIKLDIMLYRWGGWQGCSWHKIPTFGLLSNLNACKNGVPCPIRSGKNMNIRILIDFTKYNAIISLLKNDYPYQIIYKLTDIKSERTSCVVVQARSLTKS